MSLEGVDDVKRDDGFAAGMLSICDRVANDGFEEHLEDIAGFLVDETGDALDAATACESTNRRLGDALDVVTKDLAMALGASLP